MRGLLAVLALLAQPFPVQQLQPQVAGSVPFAWLRAPAQSSSPAARADDPSGARNDTARSVFVDLVATDNRGRAVEGLKHQDFELREDGTLRAIDEVRFVKLDADSAAAEETLAIQSEADERTAAARLNARLFAIFLDEYQVDAANTARVRRALAQFVDETLNPSDLIVVMRPLDSLLTIRMTRDHVQARRAIEEFEGRKGDHTPRNASERSYIAGTPERIEQLRAQVATSALNALAIHLGSLRQQGRKTLIVVSEGLPRVGRRRGFESLATIDSVIRSANQSNVAVYTVDPRPPGQPGQSAPDAADALRTLPAVTGGQFIAHADLQIGMRSIATDAGAYYLLAYQPAQQPDGEFHDVQVSVRRPGVTVRTRSGYWASSSEDELRAALSVRRPVPMPDPPRRISSLIKPWFGAARGADGKTRVTFIWEPAGRVPGERNRRPSASRVMLKALAADGTSLFEGPVLAAGPLRPDSANAAEARAVFDAPPGTVRLRMSIEDQAAQAIDSDVRDLSVRDLNAPVVLGTAAFLRARTAREFRAIEEDPDAVPVAAREFSRTERLIIRFASYAPTGVSLSVSARLLNRVGQALRDLPVQKGTASGEADQIELALASLAVGQYFVEVTAKSPAGDVKDLVEFRITN
jgi:VWFA-related protein